MSGPRKLYEFLMAASVAHAKWDYEVSMSIVKNRKKMLWLLALVTPILAISALSAADLIGSKTAYAPGALHDDDLHGVDRGRSRGRADHRLHRRGRRLHHHPGADGGRRQGDPRGRHRRVPHLREGDHGHDGAQEARQRLGQARDRVPDRLRRRHVRRRLDQQDALQQGPAALRGLHQLGLRRSARLPRLLRDGGLLEVAQRQGDRRRARRARRPLGHDPAGREAAEDQHPADDHLRRGLRRPAGSPGSGSRSAARSSARSRRSWASAAAS